MDARYEYVSSRKDMALIGGKSFPDRATFSFGGQSFVVGTDGTEPKMVVLASAYEVMEDDGTRELFLARPLAPAGYREVSVGQTYEPIMTEDGNLEPTPAVASFPAVVDGSGYSKGKIIELMVQDGRYAESPDLRATVLLVVLGRGLIGESEWTDEACIDTLASVRSGNMPKSMLNLGGRMSVTVVGEFPDLAAVATESVIALDAYARKMLVLHGRDWQDTADGMWRFVESFRGNLLYSVAPFLLREMRDGERDIARHVVPLLRLRQMLMPDDPYPTMTMRCEDMRSRRMFVALSAMSSPEDCISIAIEGYGAQWREHVSEPSLATELGRVIDGEDEAHHVLSAATSYIMESRHPGSRLCVSALLGSDWGRWLLPEKGGWSGSVATEFLLATAEAAQWHDDAWADWVASSVRSVVGSVAYAEAVKDMIVPACRLQNLDDALDIVSPDSTLGIDDASPDWAVLAKQARIDYDSQQRKRETRRQRDMSSSNLDWDYDLDYGIDLDWEEDWDSCEESLYTLQGDSKTWKADMFVDMCRLFHVCRHAFRYLDGMGIRILLDAYPELRLVMGDDGSPVTIHNDVVAAAGEGFRCLVTEDGYDEAGTPTGVTFPGIVTEDGSVLGVHAEPRDNGFVGRLTCDGGNDCYLLPADMDSFKSVEEIREFLFAMAVALEEPDGSHEESDDGIVETDSDGSTVDDMSNGRPEGNV